MKNSEKTFVIYYKTNLREISTRCAYIKAPNLEIAKRKMGFNKKIHILRERVI